MIELERLNGERIVVQAVHILTIERTPDTRIGLTTGDSLLVREDLNEVVARATAYLRGLAQPAALAGEATAALGLREPESEE